MNEESILEKQRLLQQSKAKMKNPYDEQRLRDEVIYLHYLWHQGPPNPNPSLFSSSPHHWRRHQQHPFPPSHTRSLPPVTSSVSFKKKKKKGTKPDSPGWPCPHLPDYPQTGWPLPKPRSDPPPLQPQEKERLSALQSQYKACKAFREFTMGSDNDDDEVEEEEEEDSDDSRLEEFEEFFIRVFMEDNELRGYYHRCFENGGEFICLVCGGAAEKKKSGKKYKNCIGLVQHSKLILRTPNKMAHRAFGQALCKLLGWDIHRLPTIVIKGEPLGLNLNPAPPQGEPKESVAANDDGKDGSCKTEDIGVSLEHVEDPVEEHAKGVNQIIGECSSKEGDIDAKVVDVCLENGGGEAQYEGETKEKVVSLGHDDEPVEEHARGVDQSISEVINL